MKRFEAVPSSSWTVRKASANNLPSVHPPKDGTGKFSRTNLLSIGIGAFVFLALIALGVRAYYPWMEPVQQFRIFFPREVVGTAEPLIMSGKTAAADLLYVRYVAENTAVFGYDHWGGGGPVSPPVTFEPGSVHTLTIGMEPFLNVRGRYARNPSPLWVVFDSKEILKANVPSWSRGSDDISYAKNTAGSPLYAATFRGTILAPDGQVLSGTVRDLFPRRTRLEAWFRAHPDALRRTTPLGQWM